MLNGLFHEQIENSEEFKTVIAFDCRGVEPVDYDPRVSESLSFHSSLGAILLYFWQSTATASYTQNSTDE